VRTAASRTGRVHTTKDEEIRISIPNEFGTAVIYVPADLAQPTDIFHLIETTEETFESSAI